jgi:carbamoyl-phosphate synthase large subunit
MHRENILISSAGRRVGLTQCFRSALKDLGLDGKLLAVDASVDSPATHLVDESWQVPRCTDPAFLPEVLRICEREKVLLLVPTIDTELLVYARAKHLFAEIGCHVSVPSPETVAIASDKVETHAWLIENGFPTVRQATPGAILADPGAWTFPLIVKPARGSASQGVARVESLEKLRYQASQDTTLVAQELARGEEFTINVFVDGRGQCLCAVPHRRIEVRAGEVSKAVTVKNRALMQSAREVVERLPGAYGALNIQCFVDAGEMKIIEINARFGGGYPLADRAGAKFTRWLLEDCLQLPSTASFEGWEDDLAMLRYDEAVFLSGQEIRREHAAAAVSGV